MKFISLFFFAFILACSGGSSDYNLSKTEEASADFEYEESPLVEEYDIDNDNVVQENQTPREQKIIKTANLRFEAPKPEETHRRILDLAQGFDAYVQSDNAGKRYNQIYRNMIIRVPTENFQAFVDGISEGVEYFEQKDISRKDVTEEFVDLEARLN